MTSPAETPDLTSIRELVQTLAPKQATLLRAILNSGHLPELLDALDGQPTSLSRTANIEHAAAWVADLERARDFYERWFGVHSNSRYHSRSRAFSSYFLRFSSGARLEIMQSPGEQPRQAHIAISVGSSDALDTIICEMESAGVEIVSHPRRTGDGYYEAVIRDTEGNLIEITA